MCGLITAALGEKGQVVLAINALPDHVHLFISQEPECSLTELVDYAKEISREFVNGKKVGRQKFEWQEGFASFSYSPSHAEAVIRYINNQLEYHLHTTFEQEMIDMLDMLEVEYTDHELFAWFGS